MTIGFKKKWVFFIFVAITLISKQSYGATDPKILISYPVSQNAPKNRFYKEWQSNKDLLPGSYRFKANVVLKKSSHPMVIDSFDLPILKANLSSPNSLQLSQSNSTDSSTGNTLSKDPSLLQTQFFEKGIRIQDYDELHLDYKKLAGTPSSINLRLIVSGKKLRQKKTTVEIEVVHAQPKPVKILHLDSSPWEKKGFSYLFRRLLGLSFTSSWKHIIKHKKLIFQRRLHIDLSSIDTVDILFKPDSSWVRDRPLECNFSINFGSFLNSSKFIECRKFQQRIIEVNGQLVRRIWVGDQLRSKYGDKKEIYLDEIIFFFPLNEFSTIQSQPISKITFGAFSTQKKENGDHTETKENGIKPIDPRFKFKAQTMLVAENKKRLVFPLDRLIAAIGKNGTIHQASLTIHAQPSENDVDFHLHRLRLVNFVNYDRPGFFGLGEKLSRRWGGPFFDLTDINDKIEWINVLKIFSFNFHNTQPRLSNRPIADVISGLPNSSIKTKYSTFNFRSIQISTQGNFTKRNFSEKELRLEANSNWLEIDWPIQKVMDKNSRLFIHMDDMLENLANIKLIPIHHDKELAPITLRPNKANELKIPSEKIDRFRVRFIFRENRFNIKLKELALFTPVILTPNLAFDTRTLIEGDVPLVPQHIKTSSGMRVDVVQNHLSAPLFPPPGESSKLTWETKIDNFVGEIQALRVTYKVSPFLYSYNPCWLQFTLQSSTHQAKHSVCPEISSGIIDIPAETLFKNTDFKTNELLKQINWEIHTNTGKGSSPTKAGIEIGVKLIAHNLRTIRHELTLHPIIKSEKQLLFPRSLPKPSDKESLPSNFWADLGLLNVKSNTENNLPFEQVTHPYLQIKNIVLEKIKPISLEEMKALVKSPSRGKDSSEGENHSSYRSMLFLLLVIVIIWKTNIISHLKRGIQFSPEVALTKIGLFISWMANIFSRLKLTIQSSLKFALTKVIIFATIATICYLLGFLFSILRWHLCEETFLSLAGIPVVLAWRVIFSCTQSSLQLNWPNLAIHIYRGPGTPYLTGFFVSLILAGFFMIVKVNLLAEHIGVISYYMLITGVYLEARSWHKTSSKAYGDENLSLSENEAPRA